MHAGGSPRSLLPPAGSQRLALKLRGLTPGQLPPALLPHLEGLLHELGAAVEQGFVRPGCVHLTLQLRAPLACSASPHAVQDALAAALGWRAVLGALGSAPDRSGKGGGGGSHDGRDCADGQGGLTVLQQLGDEVWLVRDGALVAQGRVQDVAQAPALCHVSPCCVSTAAPGGSGCGGATADAAAGALEVVLFGEGVWREGVRCLARSQGVFLPVVALQQQQGDPHASPAADAAGSGAVQLELQAAPAAGLVYVECEAGCFVSEPCPLLLVDDPGVAREVCGLEAELQSPR